MKPKAIVIDARMKGRLVVNSRRMTKGSAITVSVYICDKYGIKLFAMSVMFVKVFVIVTTCESASMIAATPGLSSVSIVYVNGVGEGKGVQVGSARVAVGYIVGVSQSIWACAIGALYHQAASAIITPKRQL